MRYPDNITPRDWAVRALDKFKNERLDNFAALAEVGTGKTGCIITFLRFLLEKHGPLKILVIGPSVVIHNWKSEIKKFSFPDEFEFIHTLDDATKRKAKMAEVTRLGAKHVVITNYESFDSAEFVKLVHSWYPDVIVCDELHRLKSYKSKRAKAIVDLSERAGYRFGLTGTAILNSPMDIFMQWKFLDKGESFGRNFFDFRNKYFFDKNAKWAGKPNYFPNWQPIPEKFLELAEKIQKNSIRVLKKDCLDLPPLIEETRILQMTAKQKRMYDQMEKDFVAWLDDNKKQATVAQLALTKALRLMQLASGFAKLDDGTEVIFEDNPKLDAMEAIITDNPDEKFIVWCSFKANYTAIAARLEKLGIKFAMLTGEQNTKEKAENIQRFQEDPETRGMLANRKAGGIGVNLVAGSINIIVSRNFSLEEEIQTDGRTHRGGSEIHERILKINLEMQDTIEPKIIRALQGKQNISDIIIDLKHQ